VKSWAEIILNIVYGSLREAEPTNASENAADERDESFCFNIS